MWKLITADDVGRYFQLMLLNKKATAYKMKNNNEIEFYDNYAKYVLYFGQQKFGISHIEPFNNENFYLLGNISFTPIYIFAKKGYRTVAELSTLDFFCINYVCINEKPKRYRKVSLFYFENDIPSLTTVIYDVDFKKGKKGYMIYIPKNLYVFEKSQYRDEAKYTLLADKHVPVLKLYYPEEKVFIPYGSCTYAFEKAWCFMP